jgi:hypothetical protein
MPRHNRRAGDSRADRPAATSLGERRESWRGQDYAVRAVTGAGQQKVYRCPGCDQTIAGGPHLVVWPSDDLDAGDRRHWHNACWQARDRRAPGIARIRSAPHY